MGDIDLIKNYIFWLQEHMLAIVAFLITILLLYHYLMEKGKGVNLSKKYRNSIFEAQSKIFLNATQYLIKGERDLAIKEFLNAVDLNRETIDTYFALGGLFRSNGQIEKAISIHRSLIARSDISESTRLKGLKELAMDFDKGGLLDRAIETYKDVLKINRDQEEVIQALCRIYEDIEEWDDALSYRMMLGKIGTENQSETISHIYVQKAKKLMEDGKFSECLEELEEAFRFAPSVSAKVLRLKFFLAQGLMEDAKQLFLEIIKEHPIFVSFIFGQLSDKVFASKEIILGYDKRLKVLKDFFLDLSEKDLQGSSPIVLAKMRLLKTEGRTEEAYQTLKQWMDSNQNANEILKVEFIKLLIEVGRSEEAIDQTKEFLENFQRTKGLYFCGECGYNSDSIFWRCPQCREWETIQFRWKI